MRLVKFWAIVPVCLIAAFGHPLLSSPILQTRAAEVPQTEILSQETLVAQVATDTSGLLLKKQGILDVGAARFTFDGSLYHEYTFEGYEGQSITISLDSNDFDTYLAVLSPSGQLLKEHDDISEENTNSLLTITLPVRGIYRVIVNAYDQGGRGQYNLVIRNNAVRATNEQ